VFSVAPLEHVATASIRAQAADGATGELRVSLPVVPGALHAEARGEELLLKSPIPRDFAYYALVDRGTRHAGGAVALSPSGRLWEGRAPLPKIDARPLWVVVSSEPDLRSGAAVGWPLEAGAEAPPRTLDVYDHLLLDGSKAGFAREQRRLSRVRWTTAALCVVALALTLALLVARVRSADRHIAAHLGEAGLGAETGTLAPARVWFVAVASLAVVLGFLVLALLVLYRV
jgi:hypothetical protein